MQIQDIYVKTYYRIVGRSIFLRPIRLIVRSLANIHLKYAFRFNRVHNKCTDSSSDVVVSLTSFPARIGNLWIVVESLLRQSVKPRKIIIWLSQEQFTDKDVPASLRELEPRGVEIRLVDGDIRSHKKYYYVFQEYPNDLILLADDDIIYPSDLINDLLDVRKLSCGEKIVSHKYGYKMMWDELGKICPYLSWGTFYESFSGNDLFFGSGGGTLLKPSDLYGDVLNLDLALKLCPKADDVWLNAMARLGGCYYYKLKNGPILSVQNKNNETLANSNLGENQNDIQIKSVIAYYQNNIGKDPYMRYEK